MSEIETMLRRAATGLPDAVPDVGERAEAEGLVDVAYTSVDSPLGPLFVVSHAMTAPLGAGASVSIRFLPEAGGVVVLP